MICEAIFKGTPDQFGAVVRGMSLEVFVLGRALDIVSDGTVVAANLTSEGVWFGQVKATPRRGGGTTLQVYTSSQVEVRVWEMMRGHLEQDGWIDTQPAVLDASTAPTRNTGEGRGKLGAQTQLVPNTLRFELIFNGTPARFGFLVRDLKQRIREESSVPEWMIDRDPFTVYPVALPPDVQSVDVTFGDPNSDDTAVCGHVAARSSPGDKAQLIVSAEKESWPSLAQWWELIRTEAERQGFLDAQPMQAGSTPAPTEALAGLRQQLVDSFSEEELRTVCFDLGIDYESLPAQGKAGKARELVALCERNDNTDKLVAQCSKIRPNVSWQGKRPTTSIAETSQPTPPQVSNVTIIAQTVNIGGDVAGSDITKVPPSSK